MLIIIDITDNHELDAGSILLSHPGILDHYEGMRHAPLTVMQGMPHPFTSFLKFVSSVKRIDC